MIDIRSKLEMYCTLCKWKKTFPIKNITEYGTESIHNKDEIKQPFWKRRYLIVLHGFAVYFLINAARINMSIAMVAMVDFPGHLNHTGTHKSNITVENIDGNSHDQFFIKYTWSPKIQGSILGASFTGYFSSLIIGGKLAETFGPRIILITGTFISSFCPMFTPLAASISPYFVMFMQCLLGVGQGFMFPATAVLSANWFPSTERGLLSGLAFSGFTVGIIVTGILSSLICDSVSIGGWPTTFYTLGGFGIFLLILQILSLKSLPKDDSKITGAELKFILENQENKLRLKRPAVPWGKILCSMPTYALIFARFGQLWIGNHFIEINATFLATILHYPMTQNGTLIATPFILSLVLTWLSSYLISFLSSKEYLSISKIRKLTNLTGCVIYSLCLTLMIFTEAENTVTVITTFLGVAIMSLGYTGIMVVPLDMTPTFAGTLSALSATSGSLSGFILPVVYGVITNEEQTIEQWNKFFVISIVVVMSSAIFFCVFGSAEIQSYNFVGQDISPKSEEKTKKNSKPVELKDIG